MGPRQSVGKKAENQDTFDHDKGQKSAISGRRLHWRLSTGFFAFSYVQFSKTSPLKSGEKVAKNPVEKIASNPVTSVAVMVFSALNNVQKNPAELLETLEKPGKATK